ncbi:ABC transporter permease [Bacillus massiliglaciei]|uniref:ABC transporter permease n=1 Tax=Bacillus massiliglaciei TaxID=1816693 RepID=UPI000ABD32F5|nr:ABC transporter permease [Bacillus massiliglaciei]
MDIQLLWKERFIGFSKEIQRYLKYIFNGHFAFVLVLGLGGLAYYYSNWVKTLDSGFPAVPIAAFILTVVLTNSPVHTFLKEADTVFLLPLETKMGSYFQRSIFLSFILQGYILLFVFAAIMPMYAKVTGAGIGNFIFLLLAMLILKLFNLNNHWLALKFPESSAVTWDWLVRFVINLVALYFLLNEHTLLFAIIPVLLHPVLYAYYKSAVKGNSLKWERLIHLESKRMLAFYRVANLFTDVPKLRGKAARRKWLDWLLGFVPYRQASSYMYLYARTILRSNDYLGLLVRLSIIGSVVLYVVSNLWAVILVTLLFLYMTGIQLLPMWKVHELKIWVSLYPLPAVMRQQAVLKLIAYFLLAETVIFALVLAVKGNWLPAACSLISGSIFIAVFFQYAKKKLKSF